MESTSPGRGSAPLLKALGHDFKDETLLPLALTHPSLAGREESYERLEFLGDRVLGLVVADLLYRNFPDETEGAMARRFAGLVRQETLARVAHAAGMGAAMRLADSDEAAGHRENPSILSDICEAVIAALYLDGGLEAAARFVRQEWTPLLAEDLSPPQDAKTALQEWAQGQGLPLPRYHEMSRSGPDHAPVFRMQVSVEGFAPEVGEAGSKRQAEQLAAAALLDKVRGT